MRSSFLIMWLAMLLLLVAIVLLLGSWLLGWGAGGFGVLALIGFFTFGYAARALNGGRWV